MTSGQEQAGGTGAGTAAADRFARTDGFAPIESYGVIGDGESVALVARDGAIDWWAAPAIDSPPLFAAALDPRDGGSFTLEPAAPYEVTRRYLPGTNVLETTFSTGDGTVRVIDSLNQSASGLLPWAELARDIRAEDGEVPMRWRIAPGTLFHRVRPWARLREVPILHAGDLMMAIVAERTGKPQLGLGQFSGEFVARKGHDALLALVVADHAPLVVPSVAEVRERRATTEVAWREWCDTVPYRGEDRELVLRSTLALKLLTYAPTGAMAAAATTSLPEKIGGERNYDYRYGWIRDTSFVLDSFIQLGLTREVQGTLAWMLGCISATAPVIHPFYGLRGRVPDTETELQLRGYRDSAPVRAATARSANPSSVATGTCSNASGWPWTGPALTWTRPAPICSTRWATTCATSGPSRTAGSGSWRNGSTTRSPRSAAGSRSTG